MEEQSIAKALKYLMERDRTSVSAVSAATGIPAQTLYSTLAKKTNQADLGTLEKLAEHFGVGLEIFCGVEKYKPPLQLGKDEQTVIDVIRGLNEKGQLRLYEYAMELKANPMYEAKGKQKPK